MNLFCGFYAIIASMSYDFILAANFIILAAILDSLDGRIARLTRTTSKFGSEFDSLADVVAFGVAPAILTYNWTLGAYGKFGWLVAFLYVACGALRLARFNVQASQSDGKYFKGLPIPGAALVIAMMVHLHHYFNGEGDAQSLMVLAVFSVLPLLMVSTIRYYSFKDLNYFAKKPLMSLVLVVFTMAVIVAEPQIMLFTFAFGYSMSGPVWWVMGMLRGGASWKQREVSLKPTE
jgi:CDP-diacylglycerol--serine O-phosphatidyltransferase